MSTQLRNGTTTEDGRLDRLPSDTTEHLERYPLTAATMPAEPRPMVAGVNWYSNFDSPVLERRGVIKTAWIGRGDLGRVRGGHAIMLPVEGFRDPTPWWDYYNQGDEGRCVEFATLRMLSQLYRTKFDLTRKALYFDAQREDEWPGGEYPGGSPSYSGTSVRAALEVVRRAGAIAKPRRGAVPETPSAKWAVKEYRWATSWDDVRAALGVPDGEAGVPFLNSWGRAFPHVTRITDEAGARLLAEDGELGIVTKLG